jgi:proteasome lid subunit RPN8/RPN11
VRAEAPRPKIPRATLVVRPEVVRAIAAAAGRAGNDETGGPLLGTVQRSWSGSRFSLVVSVLGTVSPGPGVQGRLASVCLGAEGDGERAESTLRWLRATTGLDLVHLGDWHSHPSGVCKPSLGDVKTAEAMLAESGAAVWLTAIAVSRCDRGEDVAASRETVRYTRERLDTTEVGFYQLLGRALVPLQARIEGDALPRLPPPPWHVADPARFAAECRLLAAAGYRTAIDASSNGLPGLSLRVLRESARPLTLVTGPGFPQRAPELHDERGRRLVPRSSWSPDRFLVDLVREVSP